MSPGFIFHTFSVLALLGNPGNLSFWIFDLSFCKSSFCKSRLFLAEIDPSFRKIGLSFAKYGQNLSFFLPEFLQKSKKNPDVYEEWGIFSILALRLLRTQLHFLLHRYSECDSHSTNVDSLGPCNYSTTYSRTTSGGCTKSSHRKSKPDWRHDKWFIPPWRRMRFLFKCSPNKEEEMWFLKMLA